MSNYAVKLTNVNDLTIVLNLTVVSDGVIEGTEIRYFVTEEGVRYEAPMSQFLVQFSADRMKLLQKAN